MNKQSSIEWLSNQTYELFEQYSEGKFDRIQLNKFMVDATNKAKEMHKQEIGYAFSDGWNDCEKSFKDEQLENDEYCEKHPDEKIMTQRFCNICQSFDYEGWDD